MSVGSMAFWGSLVAADKLHGLLSDSPVSMNIGHMLQGLFLVGVITGGIHLII